MWIKREKKGKGLTEVTLLYCNKQVAMHCFLNKDGRIRGKAEVYDFDGNITWSFELNNKEEITGTFVEPGYGQDMDTHTSIWKDGVCIDPGDDEYLEVGSTVDDLEWLLDGDTEPFVDDYVVQLEEANCDDEEEDDDSDDDDDEDEEDEDNDENEEDEDNCDDDEEDEDTAEEVDNPELEGFEEFDGNLL